MTVYSGPDGVRTYTAIVLKIALDLYAESGIKVNTAYTPTAMLTKAGEITGRKFKRGEYKAAASALEAWLLVHGTKGGTND